MNIYDVQNAVIDELITANIGYVKDTDWEDVSDVPTGDNGLISPYHAVRSNSPNTQPLGGAVGGPRHDEMYTLIDVVTAASDPDECRSLAYGPGGVSDTLIGFKPTDDSGPMSPTGTGSVFVRGSDTQVKPRLFYAINSFRVAVNFQPS